MLELYTYPQSTCSQKVRLALAEKRLEWIARPTDLTSGAHLTASYLALNPNGVVPTLVHDGRPVIDSSVITEYLEDVFPTPALRPADPLALAHMRAWRAFIDEVPTPAIRPPSFNAFIVQGFRDLPEPAFAAAAEKRPLRKHFYRRMTRNGFDQAAIDEALDDLRSTLLRMDAALANGPWVCGEMFTLADISLTPTIVRMEDLALDHMWADLPRVADWYARIQARPSFALAYAAPSRDIMTVRRAAC
jgi:glutathione S-transferase